MYRKYEAFGTLRRSTALDSRRPRKGSRTLGVEYLEVRQMLSGTSTFTIVNNTVGYDGGKFAWLDNQIHVALYCENNDGTTYYYFDSSGTPHDTTTLPLDTTTNLRTIPTFLLNSLTKTAEHTYTIDLPQDLDNSGYGPKAARLLFSVDGTIDVTANADGTVNAPVPDSSFEYYYDFVEFTLNAPNNPVGNLNINTSSIDQFGMPIVVDVDSTKVGINALRTDVVNQYETFTANTPFSVDVWPTSGDTWGAYRISSPADVMSQASTAAVKISTETFLNSAINAEQTTINVNAAAFPNPNTDGSFNIRIFNEIMTVTAAATLGNGTTNWTVTRGVSGTTAAGHAQFALVKPTGPGITANQTTVTVLNTTGFPTTYPFLIKIDNEIMKVTGLAYHDPNNGWYTWNVERGQYGTTAASHQQDAIATYDSVIALDLNSYFNQAIDDLFEMYSGGTKLDLQYTAPGAGSATTYEGTVTTDTNGAYVMQFTEKGVTNGTKYNIYYPFFNQNRYYWAGYTPKFSVSDSPSWALSANLNSLSPSEMVLACNGVFADNKFRTDLNGDEQTLLGNLENQVVSALNRGVATLASSDWANSGKFYGNNTSNEVFNIYAQFLHQSTISIDGKAYAFAFDDQGGHASDIGVSSFTNATITLGPWGNLPLSSATISIADLSLRYFLSSYFASQSSSSSSSDPVEAQSQLTVAPPEASPQAAVDTAFDTAVSDDTDLYYLASYGNDAENNQDDEFDPTIEAVMPSLRLLLSSRLAS